MKLEDVYNPKDYYHQKLKIILDSNDASEQLAQLVLIRVDGFHEALLKAKQSEIQKEELSKIMYNPKHIQKLMKSIGWKWFPTSKQFKTSYYQKSCYSVSESVVREITMAHDKLCKGETNAEN